MKRLISSVLLFIFCMSSISYSEEIHMRGSVEMIDASNEYSALPLEGIKIGIDPGHQAKANNDREAVAPGSREKKAKVASGTSGIVTNVPEYVINLEVSFLLVDALESLGAEVLMTRYQHDVDISNQQRAKMMNEWGADLVLRIHANGSTDQTANGIGMYVRKSGACSEESALLAEKLLEEMVLSTCARRDGLYKRNTYTGLNWSEVPSVLVEMGYLSNPAEDQKLNDPEYWMLLVEGMVNGIIEYVYDDSFIREP